MRRFLVNDWVIYHQHEASTRPAPRARMIRPAERGDLYSYVVDRLWRVVRVGPDGSIEAEGKGGTVHHVRADDPLLEKANWWRRLVRRHAIVHG